ncbi:MAG: hypothetical protein N2A99_06110, partial [Carnobacterium alterfunditum]
TTFLIFVSRFVGLFQPVSATCINITGIKRIVNNFWLKIKKNFNIRTFIFSLSSKRSFFIK